MKNKSLEKSGGKELEVYGHEILSNDDFLRKIYHAGYNSKVLTKSFANSIVFEKEAKKIIQLIESKEITIRSCGPLLLGLIRVYDKIVKNFLEEIKNVFADKAEEKKAKKAAKSKDVTEEENTESIDKNVSTTLVIKGKEKKQFENLMSNYLLSSPLKQGIFSMLADQTPSKFKGNLSSEKKDFSSIEAFRPDVDTPESRDNELKSSEIKIKENKNVKLIREAPIYEENDADFNNFFHIISENQKKEGDLIKDLLENEIKFNMNEEFKQQNIDMDINFNEPKVEEELKFTENFEEKLKNFRSKKMKYNVKLVSDNAINFDKEKELKHTEDLANMDDVDLYKKVKIFF